MLEMSQLAVTYSFRVTHPGGGHVYGYLLIFNICILVSSNVVLNSVHNCSLIFFPQTKSKHISVKTLKALIVFILQDVVRCGPVNCANVTEVA